MEEFQLPSSGPARQRSPTPLIHATVVSPYPLDSSTSDLVTSWNRRRESSFRLTSDPEPLSRPIRNAPRRSSYDQRTTVLEEGILRRSWFSKRCSTVPAVFVVVAASSAPENLVLSALESAQKISRDRGSKVVVAMSLVGQDTPSSVDERVQSLRKKAELEPRQVLLCLGKSEQIFSTAEQVLSDLACQYYKEEARRKKTLAKTAPKLASLGVVIRMYVKAGFLSEFRRDFVLSMKYYRAAMSKLGELRAYEQRKVGSLYLHEVKHVAAVVNFRMCCILAYEGRQVAEAVAQFSSHVREYGSVVAIPFLEFTHWSWLASQQEAFGDLLENLKELTAKERGASHSAFWYEAAAVSQTKRKQCVLRDCESLRNNPSVLVAREVLRSLPPSSQTAPPFIGRFHKWKDDVMQPEEEAMRAVAWELYFSDTAADALKLFVKAKEAVKQQGGANNWRSLSRLDSQIAARYAEQGQWEQAKRLCDEVSATYKRERWWDLLTPVDDLSRTCAAQLGSATDFVYHSLELLTPASTLPLPRKLEIQKELADLCSNAPDRTAKQLSFAAPLVLSVPIRSPLCSHSPVSPFPFVLFCSLTANSWLNGAVQINARFIKRAAVVGESIRFVLELTSFLPDTLVLSDYRVLLDSTDCTMTRILPEGQPLPIVLTPKVPRSIEHLVVASHPCKLHCTSVELDWGVRPTAVVLHCAIRDSTRARAPSVVQRQLLQDSTTDSANELSVVEKEPAVVLTSERSSPALVGEFFAYSLKVKNRAQVPVTSCSLLVDAPSEGCLFEDPAGERPFAGRMIETLAAGDALTLPLFFRVPSAGDHVFVVTFEYDLEGHKSLISFEDTVASRDPFSVSFVVVSKVDKSPLPEEGGLTLLPSHSLFMSAVVQPTTVFPLTLHKLSLVQDATAPSAAKCIRTFGEPSSPIEVTADGRRTLVCSLHVPETLEAGALVELGALHVVWSRVADGRQNVLSVPAPRARLQSSAVSVEQDVDSLAYQGSMLPCRLQFHNDTRQPQEVEFFVDETASFFVNGTSHGVVLVPPSSSSCVSLGLLPLCVGSHALPLVRVVNKEIRMQLPTRTVFVHPTLSECQACRQ